jgi:hypothetical protein
MEAPFMETYALSQRTSGNAYTHHVFDTIANYGLFAAPLLAAYERQRDSAHWLPVPVASHPARTPEAVRHWLGALLVRIGSHLQGTAAASLIEHGAVLGSPGAAG